MARIVDLNDEVSILIRDMYLSGSRVYEIRDALQGKLLDDGIVKRLRKMGIYKKRVNKVHYDLDTLLNLHETVDGWYLIGLLLADGSMNIVDKTDEGRNLKKISIEINTKDEDSLKRIRDRFVPTAKLSYRKSRPLVSLSFNNTEFCDYLESIGVRINKRRVEMPPLQENVYKSRDFALAFVAGYLDGDGCISFGRTTGSTTLNVNITCASPVWKELHKVLDFLGFTYKPNFTKETYVSCSFNNPENTLKILMEMYTVTDLVFNRRKERLRETINVMMESDIRRLNYGKSLKDSDTTGYFLGKSKEIDERTVNKI